MPTFMRFEVDCSDGDDVGMFTAAYRLKESPQLEEWDRSRLEEIVAWFDEHLPAPENLESPTSLGQASSTSQIRNSPRSTLRPTTLKPDSGFARTTTNCPAGCGSLPISCGTTVSPSNA